MWRWLRSPERQRLLAEAGALFLIALAPRLIGVGLFLTADEKSWMGRGVNFLQAVQEFHFNETLQTTHPGIPTLWLAGISTRVIARVSALPFTADSLHTFVQGTQTVFAVVNSVLVAALFLALRHLAKPWVARTAALAIALDPFLIGHSKVVHVDALLTGFTALSLILFLAEMQKANGHFGGSPALLVWSGITGGLAMLSKIPGLILLPLVIIGLLGSRQAWRSAERRLRFRLFGQWLVIIAATILLLWPGLLWVPDPVGNVKIVKRDVVVALSTPHHMADVYGINPWHYPKTLLARATIPALFGFAAFLLLFLLRKSPALTERSGVSRRTFTLLLAFLVLFTVGMTLGAKKGDRYLLPAFPIVDLLGVIGLTTVVGRLRPRWAEATAAKATLFLVGAPLVAELVLLGPYALAYYNRLLPPNFSQEPGWGEGLDQVARYLNTLDDGGKISVASWYPEELRALVQRPVFHQNAHTQLRIGYVVLYRNMFGRPPDHPANDLIDEYYRKRTPVFTATVNGLPYAWVYQQPTYTEILGELTEESLVVAELPVESGTFRGVEVLTATYSGTANAGTVVLRLRRSADGPDLAVRSVPVRDAADNQWVRFLVEPFAVQKGEALVVLLTTEGTFKGNAPTLRRAPRETSAPPFGLGQRGELPQDVLRHRRGRGLLGIRPVIE